MWEDREALEPLRLEESERVLDVGCGTGALTRVLAEETRGEVVALDADRGLLDTVEADGRVRGDAVELPVVDDAFDLVVSQALLVNLLDPAAAVREFARVSRGRVAVIEPDNSAVSMGSSVEAEAPLARRAREFYLAGVETDAALGGARDIFERVGLSNVTVSRYDYERVVTPPYEPTEVEAVGRKASGASIERDRATILQAATPEEFDALREQWREMGREAARQMQAGEYRRREVVPFFVTVGEV